MKNRIVIFQIINIISVSLLLTLLVVKHKLTESVIKVSSIYSLTLFVLSLMLIIYYYLKFLSALKNVKYISTPLSIIYKFVLPNFSIGCTLALLSIGLFYNTDFLSIFLVIFVIIIGPTIIYSKVKFIVLQDELVRAYNFGGSFIEINLPNVVDVNRFFFGMIYKVKYINSAQDQRSLFFIPRGILASFFHEPDSIKLLKSKNKVD